MSTARATKSVGQQAEGSVTFTIPKSGRQFSLRHLNGSEAVKAAVAAGSPSLAPSYIAAYSVTAIDGQPTSPITNEVDLNALMQRYSFRESTLITIQYARAFIETLPEPTVTADDGKWVVAFGGKSFRLRELNGRESTAAARWAGSPNAELAFQVVCAIDRLNSDDQKPVSAMDVAAQRLTALTDAELRALASIYDQRFGVSESDLNFA